MEGTSKESKPRFKKGFWKPEEDCILRKYVETHGEGNWTTLSIKSGLMRGGKSCRLRWKNYLRPNIKHGMMSEDEKDLIIRLHKLLGNRWSLIAGRLPGRTDNEVKNYWNTHLNKTKLCTSKKRQLSSSTTSRHQEHVREKKETTADNSNVVDSWVDRDDDEDQTLIKLNNIIEEDYYSNDCPILIDNMRYSPPLDFNYEIEGEDAFMMTMMPNLFDVSNNYFVAPPLFGIGGCSSPDDEIFTTGTPFFL
ncbi:hypothetical protein ABFS83_11G042000 [Erythranthe nasuta]